MMAMRITSMGPLNENDSLKLADLLKKLKETKEKTTQNFITRAHTKVANRKQAMEEAVMPTLVPPGIKEIKQVEMLKYKKFVPAIYQTDVIYKVPDESIIKNIKDAKNERVRERTKRNKKAKHELLRRLVRRVQNERIRIILII
jgi:hypothetical protein